LKVLVQGADADLPGHYNCVGVGVGPADKKETTTIQVSMLKDLFSLSEPTSEFTFLAYLHEYVRLYYYLNAQFHAVPRKEFGNYLQWACRKNENITFGNEVPSVDYSEDVFYVRLRAGTVTAGNIVIGVGIWPWVPSSVVGHLGDRNFHVSVFLVKAGNVGGLRVGVVGGGQSGAEAFLDLISCTGTDMPRRVVWISRRPNYSPLDDSPFTNDYYMPGYSDYFAGCSQRILDRLRGIRTEQHLNSFIEWMPKPAEAVDRIEHLSEGVKGDSQHV
jgi:lysine N6-hydroxylase